MSRALVTGGAGFLGRSLAARLLEDGWQVVILDDLSSASPLGAPAGADLVEGSVVDPPDLGAPFDRIYHLASPASPPRYLLDPVGTLRTGAEGTHSMLRRAEVDGALFLISSTSEVYGDPLEHPQREGYAGNVWVTSPRACYDEAKRYAEALVYAFERTGRIETARVARIFNTYGPGMDPGDGRVVTNFISQALTGRPLTIQGDGSQTRSFCFVDDLIDGILRLADSDLVGPVNLGNPHEITMNELADRVAAIVGDTGREFLPLPESDPLQRRPDIERARTELGWEPKVALEAGLEATVAYVRSVIDG